MVRTKLGFHQGSLFLKLDASQSPVITSYKSVFPQQLRVVDGLVFSTLRIKEKS